MTLKKLVIAIDCDDVLVPATEFCVSLYNARFGTNVQLKDAHNGSSPEWGADRGEVIHRLMLIQSSADFASIEPFKEAIEVCGRLSLEHELHIVTGRHEKAFQATIQMADRFFPDMFTKVHHIGADGNKGDLCAAISADILIDDNPKHLADASLIGVKHLLWFGEYIWSGKDKNQNQSREFVPCVGWSDVESEVKLISDGRF